MSVAFVNRQPHLGQPVVPLKLTSATTLSGHHAGLFDEHGLAKRKIALRTVAFDRLCLGRTVR